MLILGLTQYRRLCTGIGFSRLANFDQFLATGLAREPRRSRSTLSGYFRRLANPRWGAPRIHGELLKIGIAVSQATVAKYMVRHRKPPSQTWRTFLKNHAKDLVSADFFVVPTITFQLLFVFVILDHDRRRPLHFAVTSNPTAEWTARQLLQAFPWDHAPRYLLRDRDSIYGEKFCETAQWMGIREVLTAPRSADRSSLPRLAR